MNLSDSERAEGLALEGAGSSASRRACPSLHFIGALNGIQWLALAASVCLTLVAYVITRDHAEEKRRASFERSADQLRELVIERMQKYEDALWSGVAAIQMAGGEVTHEEWRTFGASMQIEHEYPGLHGMGVIRRWPRATSSSHVEHERETRPGFNIHPLGIGDEVWPIVYLEPNASNGAAVGLDITQEATRYAAAQAARDSGRARITGPVTLVQDAEQMPGFVFFAPLYRKPGVTLDERRGSLVGFVFAPLLTHRLMEGSLARTQRNVGVRISDGQTTVYDDRREVDSRFDPDPLYQMSFTLPMYGRAWSFELRSDLAFRQISHDDLPLTILISGAVVNTLLLALFLAMTRNSRKTFAYAAKVTQEVRAQRDRLERTNLVLRRQSVSLNEARVEAEAARESAEQATRAKARFLATMSHELRTPMNGVIATAELLRSAETAAERGELTETIIRSGQSLLAIINDILDFSKLDAGKVSLDPQPTSVRALLRDIVALLQAQIEANDVTMTTVVDAAVPETVLVDGLRLRQVMLNLCSNGVKFTRGGRVQVHCTSAGRDGPRHRLVFSVEDDGIGIAEPELLFREFTQADDSTTRRYGGTGLGLAISKRLVTLLGGEIFVRSALGKGSRFELELALSEHSPEAREPAPPGSAPIVLRSGTALVVDDNAVNRMVARKVLERLGWRVELAEDGEQATQKAREERFDIIFMDCQMPVLDGFEATKRIRSLDPDAPPIVALTANALPEDRELCLAAGMSDFLSKPVHAEVLQQVLSRWIGTDRAPRRRSAGS